MLLNFIKNQKVNIRLQFDSSITKSMYERKNILVSLITM